MVTFALFLGSFPVSFLLSFGVSTCFQSLTIILLGFQEGVEINAICISSVNYLFMPFCNFLLGFSCFELVKILCMKDTHSDICSSPFFCVNLRLKRLLEGTGAFACTDGCIGNGS